MKYKYLSKNYKFINFYFIDYLAHISLLINHLLIFLTLNYKIIKILLPNLL